MDQSRPASDRTILKRLVSGGGRLISAFFAQMFTLPVIAHFLDGERMGAWALLGAAGFLVGFVDLGLATAVQRSAVTEEHGRTRRLVGLSLGAQALLLPVFFLVAWLFFVDVSGASAEVQEEIADATWLVLAAGAFLGLSQPYRMFVFARGGVRQVANARTVAALLQVTVLLAGFFGIGVSLAVPAAAFLVNTSVDFVLTALAARQMDRAIPFRPRLPLDAAEAKSAFRDGSAAFVLNLAISAAVRVDLFVLHSVAPLALVGTYQVAGRAIDMAYVVAKQATAAIMRDLGKPELRERAVRVGTGAFAGVVISGMSAVAFVGQPFLIAVFDEHAAGEAAAIVLALLGSAAVITSLYEVASSMVMLGGRSAWQCATPIVVGSLVNLTLSISLSPYYGVWAVAGSTVVGNAITFSMMWPQARRILGWSVGRIVATIAPGLAALAASVTLGLLLRPLVDHWATSLGACALVSVVGLGAAASVMRFSARRAAARSAS